MIAREVAEKEVNDWLEYKKIGKSKLEKYKDNIESLVDYVSDGVLVFNDDKSIKHKLKFPLEDEMSVSEFSYKPRITTEKVGLHLQGVKTGDLQGMIRAYICALTDQPGGLVKKLDTEDYSIAQSIALFFV